MYVYIGIQYYPINHHVYYCYVPMGILYVIILLSYVIKTTNHNLIRLIKENAQENRATTLFHLDDHQCYITCMYYDDHSNSSNSSQLVRPVGCASRIKAIVVHIALHFCFSDISPPPLLLLLMLRPTSAILTRLQ